VLAAEPEPEPDRPLDRLAEIAGLGEAARQLGLELAELVVHLSDAGLVEAALGPEVVMDHRQADLGVGGDATDRGVAHPALGERGAGGLENPRPGGAGVGLNGASHGVDL
jgi:hypothetical protein